ncbi:MAG: hypothetical protein WA871_04065 [Candidatus Acidiferrales bacterium]
MLKTDARFRDDLMKIRGTIWIVALLLLLGAPCVRAATPLDWSIIGMFPKSVTEFGYADLNQARQFPWFPQFEAQLVPVSLYGFEQFLESAQMQETSPIDQVAWARVSPQSSNSESSGGGGSSELVGIATGNFDLKAIQSFLDSRNIPAVQEDGEAVYASQMDSGASDTYFTMIDSGTIAFGPLESLKQILKTHKGEQENLLASETMMNLIGQANGQGTFWGVLDSDGAAAAIQRLVPEAAQFSGAHELIGKMKQVLVILRAPGDFELDFQGTSESPDDAILLAQLLQAGLLYQQYRSSQSNPDLAQILEGASIAPSGDQVEISLRLTDDQMLGLIERNTFSFSM